jgi:hypothetical protein
MDGNSHDPSAMGFTLDMVDQEGFEGASPGGRCKIFKAGATLLVGDVVYLSAAMTVNKSLVAATVLGKLAGVVVGGYRTSMLALTRKLDQGIQAALVGEAVIVLYDGKYYVVSDAAIAVNDIITTATVTTAGRVKVGTITTDLVAGDTGRIVGNALEVAGGAGVTVLASIRLM